MRKLAMCFASCAILVFGVVGYADVGDLPESTVGLGERQLSKVPLPERTTAELSRMIGAVKPGATFKVPRARYVSAGGR